MVNAGGYRYRQVVGVMKEKISALMDGELDDKAAAQMIDTLAKDRETLDTWRTYHLISDALRDTQLLSEGFAERVAAKLAQEPTVLAPNRLKADQPRRWVAMAASVAAVALVGWLGFAPQQTAVVPVAQAPRIEPKPQLVPLPTGTNDYLLAHQGFSPRVSLQGMAPYVLTVSEQVQEPRK
jgi:sigma-E factor negative regulatory protein RseA